MRTLRSIFKTAAARLALPAVLGLAALAPLPAGAVITQTVNYQGFLLSKLTNLPVETPQAIKFLIYNVQSGGAPLFTESRCGVTVNKGRYDAEIGSMTAGGIPDTVFLNNQNLWLEIQVSPTGVCGGSYEAMTPRIRLQASPFAFNSLYASTASAASPVFAADVISPLPTTANGAVTISTNLFVMGGISVGNISPGQQLSVAGLVESKGAWPACGADPLNYTCGFRFPDGSVQLTAVANTMWNLTGGNLYSINAGNVGIGQSNSNPRARLEVSTAAGDTGDLLMLSTGTSVMFRVNGLGQVSGGSYYGDGSTLNGIVVSTGGVMTGPLTLFNSSLTVTSPSGLSSPRQSFSANVAVSSETSAALGAGIRVSSNVYIVGFSSATKYYGDGSALTSVNITDFSKVVQKAGDTMTGPLTLLSPAFSVAGSTFSVFGGSVAIGGYSYPNMLSVTGGILATSSITAQGGIYANTLNASGAAGFYSVYAASATFWGENGIGANNYSIDTASGIKVNAGVVNAPYFVGGYFVGDGSLLNNVSLKAGGIMTSPLTIASSVTVTGNGGQYGLQVSSGVSLAGLIYTNGGGVGIQTSTPTAPLEVANKILVSYGAGSDASVNMYSNGGNSYLHWSDYGLAGAGNVNQGAMGYLASRDFVFRALGATPASGGSEVFRIKSDLLDTAGTSWRFGIGTSSPVEKFHVATNVLISTSDYVSPIMYISTTAGTVSISTRSHPNALTVNGGILAVSSITAQGGFFGDASGLTNINTSGLPDQIAVSSIAARATSTYGAVVFTSDTYVNAKLAVGEVFTPDADLHIRGMVHIDQHAGQSSILQFYPNAGADTYIWWKEFGLDKGALGFQANQTDLIYRAGGSSLTSGVEAFRIKSDGKFLLGGAGSVFIPKANFQVVSDMMVSNAAGPIVFVSTASGYVGISTGTPREGLHVASSMLVGYDRSSAALYVSTATGFTGIGTGSPRAMLEVNDGAVAGNGNILAAGTDGTPVPPVTGPGTRFMWIPSGAAIRAGKVPNTEWDTIGLYSAAFGYQNTASAQASVVSGGFNNSNTAQYAVIAGGLNNVNSGLRSAVGGGSNNIVYGQNSVVPGGSDNVIFSSYSFAGGQNNYLDTTATGTFVWGYDNSSFRNLNNWAHAITGSFLFLVDPLNLMNYKMGIGVASPAERLEVAGNVKASGFLASRERITSVCNTAATCTATCSAGKYVMGGGCSYAVGTDNLNASYPSADNVWTCNYTGVTGNITAYAICSTLQ